VVFYTGPRTVRHVMQTLEGCGGSYEGLLCSLCVRKGVCMCVCRVWACISHGGQHCRAPVTSYD
jgi:hypothetical protein